MGASRVQWVYALLYALLGSVSFTSAATANETQSPPPPDYNSTSPEQESRDGGFVVHRSGLRFFDLKVGQGDSPVPGELVVVHYIASWAVQTQVITREHYGGKIFDNTRDVEDHRTPFTFTVGTNRVTPGMNEAVLSMHVGGRRIAVVPPNIGYGRLRIGTVPANSTLIYDIELLEVKGLDTRPPMVSSPAAPQTETDYDGYDGYQYYDYDSSDGKDNADDMSFEDYKSDNSAVLQDVEELLKNYTSQLDTALNVQAGTTAKGATWVFETLAILAIVAVVYVGGHYLYSLYQAKQQLKRLRQQYLDTEHGGDLELEDI